MKKIIAAVLSMTATLGILNAQTLEIGGEMIGAANMKPSDAIKFSQTDHTFMTARVAAMGGAYTSLGADLSSMVINPAGLGMYRQSVASISSAITSTTAKTLDGYSSNYTQMALNNAGMALNLFQSSGTLVSFTFGFAYNKLADFNYNQSYCFGASNVSMADFFAEQVNGIHQWAMATKNDPFNNTDIYVDEWGGVLAYQNALIDPDDFDNEDCDVYNVSAIGANADIFPEMQVNSRGYVGEYDFAAGFNVANQLYLGITLGIQDISQFIQYNYTETYDHKLTASDDVNNYLRRMNYSPRETSQGAGVNVKIGAIWRPTSSLRLGVAYHSPTAVSLNRTFYTSMDVVFPDMTNSSGSLTNSYTYHYSSPSKLLFGVSYTIGTRAVLSFDYDIVRYGQTRLTGERASTMADFNSYVKSDFSTANNFRAGVEVRPTKDFYLRGGYAFYGSPIPDAADYVYFANNKLSTEAISLGLGMRFATGSTFDLAWVRSSAKSANYRLFDYYYANGSQEIIASSPEVTDNIQTRNLVSATYSFVF